MSRTDERASGLDTALRLAWPVALVVLGAMVLATAWHRWPITLLFVVAAVVPLLLLRGALRLGLSRWAATAMLVLLTVMVAYLFTARADLTVQQTVSDVVPRLLTSPQPYAVQADLLVGPMLLTAFVSLLVGLRVDSRTRVEPVLGAAVLYVAGALLTAGAADPWGLVAVLILVVALVGWVFLDEHSEPVRQRLSIAAPVSVVGVGVLAALATLPLSQPFEPRELVTPPVTEVAATNPLTQLGAWAVNPRVELLKVRGDAVPLRLVVLDQYDGRQWTTATAYSPLGGEETGLEAGAFRTDARVQVEFAGLGGSWLPSPGTPLAVGAPGALVDPDTGTLFTPGTTDGLVYEVSGAFDDPPYEALEGAAVPEDGMEEFTRLPELPIELATYSARVTEGAVTPYQRAVAIEQQIRSDYRLSARAVSGSALWRISSFLLGRPSDPGARVGTSEQFASSFALVARFNGLPSRVVVGFRPGEEQDDGTRVVHGEDAFAWAEVYFEELGWVPFSPTPDDDTFVREAPVEADEPELPPAADTGTPGATPTDAPFTTAPATPPLDRSDADAGAGSSGRPAWAAYALGVGVVVLVVLLLAGLRLARRTVHRRRGAPGAWTEVLDALRLSGLRPPPHHSAEEVATAADALLGIDATSRLAARAELAAFGPGGGGAGGDGAGGEMQQDLRVVRRSARRATPLWRRWWWHLDPRVLRP